MPLHLTARQRDLVARAGELACERFAPRAAAYDLMQPWTADHCLERIGASVLPDPPDPKDTSDDMKSVCL